MILKFLKRLENLERNYPRIFWPCAGLLGFFLFHEPVQNPHKSEVIVQQVRGGSRDSENFDPIFHRELKQFFPDWKGRMGYQKKQEVLYKSAMRKRKGIKRIGVLDNNSYYTKKELDAIDYFHGSGFYATFQDQKPTIYDSRQRFLLKMHNDELRNEFLNSLNRRNN